MKRLASTLILLAALAVLPTSSAQRPDRVFAFDQVTEAGCEGSTPCTEPSTGAFCTNVFHQDYRVEVDVGGTMSTCELNIQGSRSPGGLFNIISTTDDSNTTCTSDTVITITDAPARCFKLVVTTFTGTTQTLDVTLTAVGNR